MRGMIATPLGQCGQRRSHDVTTTSKATNRLSPRPTQTSGTEAHTQHYALRHTTTAIMASVDDITNLPTPPRCIADFCLIPIGTPTASVSKEVAEVQRLLKKSGLEYSMHSAGTTVGT